jgi:hypothetical protein
MSELEYLISQHRSVETEIACRERELSTCRLLIDERTVLGTEAIPTDNPLAFLEAQLRECRHRRERLQLAIARSAATRLSRRELRPSRTRDRARCPTCKSVIPHGKEKLMDDCAFHIDSTPRRADGEYIAHARISRTGDDGREYDVHLSGDLAGFNEREDAMKFAADWADEWLSRHCAGKTG